MIKKGKYFFLLLWKEPSVFLWVERTVQHSLCNMNITPVSQGAGRKGNQRYWFKALWEHTLFMSRSYRHKMFRSSFQGPAFLGYSNWWWQQGQGEDNTRKGESTFSEHTRDVKHEHISKQVIPDYLFFVSFPLPVQACLQAFRIICFPRPPFRAVCDVQITMGKGTGNLFLCLRVVGHMKEQIPDQGSQSILAAPQGQRHCWITHPPHSCSLWSQDSTSTPAWSQFCRTFCTWAWWESCN